MRDSKHTHTHTQTVRQQGSFSTIYQTCQRRFAVRQWPMWQWQGSAPGALQLNAGNWVLSRRDTSRSCAAGILTLPCRLPKLATICARVRLSIYVCVCRGEAGARAPLRSWGESGGSDPASIRLLARSAAAKRSGSSALRLASPAHTFARLGSEDCCSAAFPASPRRSLAARWLSYLRRGSEAPAVRMIWNWFQGKRKEEKFLLSEQKFAHDIKYSLEHLYIMHMGWFSSTCCFCYSETDTREQPVAIRTNHLRMVGLELEAWKASLKEEPRKINLYSWLRDPVFTPCPSSSVGDLIQFTLPQNCYVNKMVEFNQAYCPKISKRKDRIKIKFKNDLDCSRDRGPVEGASSTLPCLNTYMGLKYLHDLTQFTSPGCCKTLSLAGCDQSQICFGDLLRFNQENSHLNQTICYLAGKLGDTYGKAQSQNPPSILCRGAHVKLRQRQGILSSSAAP
ncbi:hypothetical protein E2320_003949 [Naja naja]|nr:hypothetical protein E2320_003949 [Naja naja]